MTSKRLDGSLLRAPLLLDPTNYTTLARTPWAGKLLSQGIKRLFVEALEQKIGEAWEFSCDHEAPSRTASGVTLEEWLNAFPEECLSPQLVHQGRNRCDILIKLLNASTPLSLQIHPDDHHPALKPHECGKPESWLILEATPGAGLYLGFSKSFTLQEIESHLLAGTFDPDWLQFVPVKKGDYFEIEPGVPHALGPGLVILEPQRIDPGRTGKTWRMWDWNRTYDAKGALDLKQGRPRELHIKESITLLDPEKQQGPAYVETLRRKPKSSNPTNGVLLDQYPANKYYQVNRYEIAPQASHTLSPEGGYAVLTTLAGTVRTKSSKGGPETLIPKGQTAFVPWQAFPLQLACEGNQGCEFTWVTPRV